AVDALTAAPLDERRSGNRSHFPIRLNAVNQSDRRLSESAAKEQVPGGIKHGGRGSGGAIPERRSGGPRQAAVNADVEHDQFIMNEQRFLTDGQEFCIGRYI